MENSVRSMYYEFCEHGMFWIDFKQKLKTKKGLENIKKK
jgi:hypothetical protein